MEENTTTRKKFIAGSSLNLAELTGEEVSSESLPGNSWSRVDSSTFQLRTGPDYQRTKAKAPSESAYYEMIGADFFKSSNRIDNIGSKVTFPEDWLQYEHNAAGLPPIFILNAQAPSDFSINFSFFTEIDDGEGWSLIMYFKITQETINLIQSGAELPPALKLLQAYCKEAPNSFTEFGCSTKNPWTSRFKAIARIEHIEEYNLPNFITSWNSKPVLIRRTGTLLRGEHSLEMDVNIHRWGNLGRQAISALFSRFGQMVNAIGFCIESTTDEEMPENLFGCGKVIKLDPVNAVKWEDLE